MESLDALSLNLNNDGLFVMNVSLAVIMFGVALELKVEDFRQIIKNPKATLVGITSQYFMLPFLTYVLVILIRPQPSLALGMMMVAACPGGNVSNFLSMLSRANVALSVSLTALSTLGAIIMTPFNFAFWASLYEPTQVILAEIHLNYFEVFRIIVLILGIPLILGMLVRHFKENLARKISPFMKTFGIVFFGGFVVVAFAMNFENFTNYVHIVFLLVLLHSSIALSGGYSLAYLFGLGKKERKAIAIETGIQNSGLGLVLIFIFFDGLGGMALVAAWWGIWHIISGFALSWYWSVGKSALQRVFNNA